MVEKLEVMLNDIVFLIFLIPTFTTAAQFCQAL